MSRKLAPSALYDSNKDHLRRGNDNWFRKTHSQQWEEMGKEGLNEEQCRAGTEHARQLDEIVDIHKNHLRKLAHDGLELELSKKSTPN